MSRGPWERLRALAYSLDVPTIFVLEDDEEWCAVPARTPDYWAERRKGSVKT